MPPKRTMEALLPVSKRGRVSVGGKSTRPRAKRGVAQRAPPASHKRAADAVTEMGQAGVDKERDARSTPVLARSAAAPAKAAQAPTTARRRLVARSAAEISAARGQLLMEEAAADVSRSPARRTGSRRGASLLSAAAASARSAPPPPVPSPQGRAVASLLHRRPGTQSGARSRAERLLAMAAPAAATTATGVGAGAGGGSVSRASSSRKLDADFGALGSAGVAEARSAATARSAARSAELRKLGPAGQRAARLLDEETRQLPLSHARLYRQFRELDTILLGIYRNKVATVHSLRVNVEQATKVDWNRSRLEAMLAVMPGCYDVRVDTRLGRSSAPSSRRTARRQSTSADEQLVVSLPEGVAGSLLQRRRKEFLQSLHRSVAEAHAKWCKEHGLAAPTAGWHHLFPLDDTPLPEAAEGLLPEQPGVVRPMSDRELLAAAEAARSSSIQKAMTLAAENEASRVAAAEAAEAKERARAERAAGAGPRGRARAAGLAGLPASLLAKVRAREAEARSESSTEVREATQRAKLASDLPVLARQVWAHFKAKRGKSALDEEELVRGLVRTSTSSASAEDTRALLGSLVQTVPEWLSRKKLSSGWFVKVDWSVKFEAVMAKLAAHFREEAGEP